MANTAGREVLNCSDAQRMPHSRFTLLHYETTVQLWDVALSVTCLDVAYSLVFLFFALFIPPKLRSIQARRTAATTKLTSVAASLVW